MSSIGQSIVMALTVRVNKYYASSNLQAVHRKKPKSPNYSNVGRRGLLLSTLIATSQQVPDSRTELLQSTLNFLHLFSFLCLTSIYLYLYFFLKFWWSCLLTKLFTLKILSEYLKKSEENKEKNDKEASNLLSEKFIFLLNLGVIFFFFGLKS